MSALLDTNVLIRHLTGDPPGQARRATRYLADADDLRLADLIVAETVYVLEGVYSLDRSRVAELVEAVLAHRAIRVEDHELVLRALEVYERERLDFAEAYLIALAEVTQVRSIASFDRAIDRVDWVRRVEP